jgi:hypothetical protein
MKLCYMNYLNSWQKFYVNTQIDVSDLSSDLQLSYLYSHLPLEALNMGNLNKKFNLLIKMLKTRNTCYLTCFLSLRRQASKNQNSTSGSSRGIHNQKTVCGVSFKVGVLWVEPSVNCHLLQGQSSSFRKSLLSPLHVTFPRKKITLLCIICFVCIIMNLLACLLFSFQLILLARQELNQNQFLPIFNSWSSGFLYPSSYCCFDLRVSLQVHCGVTCAPAWQ